MNDNKHNLAPQKYWDESYRGYHFSLLPENDPLGILIKSFFKTEKGSVIEIGCFPGRYLPVFGQMDFILNGLDLTPDVNLLKDWLKSMDFKIGNFYQIDFAEFKQSERYNAVVSFGFIEHFTDWEDQIIKHAMLVKNRGLIMITTLNFKGSMQNFLHRHFDRENYNRHFIPSMDPSAWASILKSQGFEIIFSGYFGRFDFWTDYNKRSALGKIKRVFTYVMGRFLSIIFYFFPSNNEAYSPYCAVVARRIKEI